MTTIAILGTGLMGYPMAERFLGANFQVKVFNRTRSKAEPLAQKGAIIAPTAADALSGSDVVFLMFSDAAAIREMLFGKPPQPDLKWRTVIQAGTISPTESVELQKSVTGAGGDYFEAPVLGGPAQMRSGDLLVMVGATHDQFDNWRSLLAYLGHEPTYIGPVGKAAALKLALNQLIASHMAAFALSFGFVEQQGVDASLFMKILRRSALYAPMLDNKLSRIVERDFTSPNFPVKHLLKDVDLFLKATGEEALDLSVIGAIREILVQTVSRGLGEMDYSALSEKVRNA